MIAAAIAMSSMPVAAQEVTEEKKFSVGLASFATVVSYDTYNGSDDEDFSGFGIFGTAAVNDNVGFRLT
ncbi:hypothetical protein ACFPTY_20055 [Halomonas beimenensis]|uniref:hypothetical protein n=1 Tax=Halomonas beimenensis TaxID=475662 RepID=UPI00360AF3A8